MGDIISLLIPMLVVIVIIVAAYVATGYIARRQNTQTAGGIIRIVERVALGRDAYLMIAVVDDKPYFMSVSAGKVDLLSELSPEVMARCRKSGPGGDFKGMLDKLLHPEKTGRRRGE